MFSQTAIAQNASARAENDNLINQFLAAGGEIHRLETTERAPDRRHSYNYGPVTKSDYKRREYEAEQLRLIERIRELAVIDLAGLPYLRTANEVAQLMRKDGDKLSRPRVEQLAALGRIELKEPHRI